MGTDGYILEAIYWHINTLIRLKIHIQAIKQNKYDINKQQHIDHKSHVDG